MEEQKKQPTMAEIMADYDKAMAFLSQTPAEAWEQISEKNALLLFEEISSNISGYKKFLKEHKFSAKSLKSMEEFKKIPIVDKYNYIQKYGFNEVNTAQAGNHLYCFLLSSGTTDEPTIWTRNYQYEQTLLPLICDNYFRLYWNLDKKSTMVINAIAMGPWNAGFTMHAALRPLTQKYNLSLSTNGADLESIIYIIKKLSSYYDQTVIFSYTTFTRTILERLEEEGVDIKSLNLKLFVGGEGNTVEWCRYINNEISGDPDDLTSIIDGYGTSEGSLLGMGSALTTLIRDLAHEDKLLCTDLFGSADTVPNLFQYSPSSFYIEEVNGEVIFTSKSTAPLVRYNLHDRGGVIKFREMEQILSSHGYDYKKIIRDKGLPEHIVWQQPFVYCRGRRDDTVSVCGAKIFPEQIAPALINKKMGDVHDFKLAAGYSEKQHQLFYVLIELKKGVVYKAAQKRKMVKLYHDVILERLKSCSIDFASANSIDKKISDPNVQIFENGTGPFVEDLTHTKPKLLFVK